MNEENYWEQFMASGRIEDYLSYVGTKERNMSQEVTAGEASYAGFLCSDGNGVKPDACQ